MSSLEPKLFRSPPGRVVLWVTLAVTFFALACLRSKYGPALWPPAQRLFYLPGVVFGLFGLLTAARPKSDNTPGGIPLRGQGLFMFTVGLGCIGGAIEYDDPEGPWYLLAAPCVAALTAIAIAAPFLPEPDDPRKLVTVLYSIAGTVLGIGALVLLVTSEL